MMKLGAIAPWFGGKRTLAPLIVQQLGEHTQYFEPFCGSMAVLLSKPPARFETVSDLHGEVTNLARVLADDELAPQLYARVSRVLVSDGLLADARAADAVGQSPLQRAFWFFVRSWSQSNGVAGTLRESYQLAVRWKSSGGSPTVRFVGAVDSIPAWHERLRNVVVLTRDAFDVIGRIDDAADTAVYADPPYAAETRGSFGADAAQYLHEFENGGLFGADSHTRLRDALARFRRARIVVSYYDCPRVRQLYDGWTFIECGRQKNLARQNGSGTKDGEAPEVLIVNGEAYG